MHGQALIGPLFRKNRGIVKRSPRVPWLWLTTTVALTVALAISAAAARLVESIIIAVLLVPSLAFLVIWLVAWRRGLLTDDR